MLPDWSTLLADPRVVSFLEKVIATKADAIEPTTDYAKGMSSLALQELGLGEANQVLELLLSQGVLERTPKKTYSVGGNQSAWQSGGKEAPSYQLTAEATEALQGKVGFVLALRRNLDSGSSGVLLSGVIPGASNAHHHFDLLVAKGGKKIPVDVRWAEVNGAVGINEIFQIEAKLMNLKSAPGVVVARPRASDDARKLAAAYGLVLIEGTDVEDVAKRIEEALTEVPA